LLSLRRWRFKEEEEELGYNSVFKILYSKQEQRLIYMENIFTLQTFRKLTAFVLISLHMQGKQKKGG